MSKPFRGSSTSTSATRSGTGSHTGSRSRRDGAEAVSDDYPGERPWAFAGGTIRKAIIDVSGEPFVDLAREAAAAFARD